MKKIFLLLISLFISQLLFANDLMFRKSSAGEWIGTATSDLNMDGYDISATSNVYVNGKSTITSSGNGYFNKLYGDGSGLSGLAGGGDMTKGVYDTDANNIVDNAETLSGYTTNYFMPISSGTDIDSQFANLKYSTGTLLDMFSNYSAFSDSPTWQGQHTFNNGIILPDGTVLSSTKPFSGGGVSDHSALTSTGTYNHAQIDSKLNSIAESTTTLTTDLATEISDRQLTDAAIAISTSTNATNIASNVVSITALGVSTNTNASDIAALQASAVQLNSTQTFTAPQTFNYLHTVSSDIVATGDVTANAFYGDGSALTGISGAGWNTYVATAPLNMGGNQITNATKMYASTLTYINGSMWITPATIGKNIYLKTADYGNVFFMDNDNTKMLSFDDVTGRIEGAVTLDMNSKDVIAVSTLSVGTPSLEGYTLTNTGKTLLENTLYVRSRDGVIISSGGAVPMLVIDATDSGETLNMDFTTCDGSTVTIKNATDDTDVYLYTQGGITAGRFAGDISECTGLGVAAGDITAGAVDSDVFVSSYLALSVVAEALAADVIDETKLADDSIDSEHYNDDSIDADHIDTINCGTNCTWDTTNDEIDVDDAFLVNSANDSTAYQITAGSLVVTSGGQLTIESKKVKEGGFNYVRNYIVKGATSTIVADDTPIGIVFTQNVTISSITVTQIEGSACDVMIQVRPLSALTSAGTDLLSGDITTVVGSPKGGTLANTAITADDDSPSNMKCIVFEPTTMAGDIHSFVIYVAGTYD
jgi:hypothetical protein